MADVRANLVKTPQVTIPHSLMLTLSKVLRHLRGQRGSHARCQDVGPVLQKQGVDVVDNGEGT